MKRTLCITGLLLLLLSSHAIADPLLQRLRGEYSADKPWRTSLRTITLGTSERLVAAEFVVGDQSCSGAFSGVGSSDGQKIQFRAYKPSSPEEQQCVITIELDKTGKVATVSERNCSYFHGAQCEFSGTLVSK